MVAQFYYKKAFNMRDLIIVPGEARLASDPATPSTTTSAAISALIQSGEKKKRGRKSAKTIALKEKELALVQQ